MEALPHKITENWKIIQVSIIPRNTIAVLFKICSKNEKIGEKKTADFRAATSRSMFVHKINIPALIQVLWSMATCALMRFNSKIHISFVISKPTKWVMNDDPGNPTTEIDLSASFQSFLSKSLYKSDYTSTLYADASIS